MAGEVLSQHRPLPMAPPLGQKALSVIAPSVRRMRDVTVETRIISKEIKRIFQRVSEIIDEDDE